MFSKTGDAAGNFLDCTALCFDMANDQGIEEIQSRINRSDQSHEGCPRLSKPLLPSRVLDLEAADPRLHVTEAGERGHYLALSYCWGGPQDVITTRDNISTNMAGMLETSFPQSIQDAIRVTRKLGYRYLWVDALCILQDSTADKHSEISNMGAIYKNSTLTIAVSNSDNVHKGFLKTPFDLDGVKLPFRLPDSTLGSIKLIAESNLLAHRYKGGPLSKRGWALQEFLLSPRVILFGAGDVR